MKPPSNPPETQPPRTVAACLQEAARAFAEGGIDSPRLTAEILLAFVRGCDRGDLYRDPGGSLSAGQAAAFRELVARRLRREPTAYLTGRRGFWNLDLEVGPEVLIPRPETERVVEAALEVIGGGPSTRVLSVLELGCGSGAIVIALAREAPRHRYFASDRSPAAVRIARRNALAHGCGGRIRFWAADWFSALRPGAGPFDLIVSNPPYIPSGRIASLQPEIALFEPRAALDGGPDGLEAYRAILDGGWPFLAPGGFMLLEIGEDQREALERLAVESGRRVEVACLQDLAGRDRVLRIAKKSLPVNPTMEYK